MQHNKKYIYHEINEEACKYHNFEIHSTKMTAFNGRMDTRVFNIYSFLKSTKSISMSNFKMIYFRVHNEFVVELYLFFVFYQLLNSLFIVQSLKMLVI